MFICYLDDSGTSGLPIVTLAGFLANDKVWQNIEMESGVIFARYGINLFHAKEFHDTKGEFKGWSKVKKHTFARDLFEPLKNQMFALSISVRKEAFESYKARTGKEQRTSSFGLCFSSLVMKIVTEKSIEKHLEQERVSFMVEAGNSNNGELEEHFKFLKSNLSLRDVLDSIEFIPKKSCRAIQLADYWAFYSRRMMRDHDRFSGKFALPEPFYVQIIKRNFPCWQTGVSNFDPKAVFKMKDAENPDDLRRKLEA
jgi:Protein of unknown function (DUF3800)